MQRQVHVLADEKTDLARSLLAEQLQSRQHQTQVGLPACLLYCGVPRPEVSLPKVASINLVTHKWLQLSLDIM